VSPAEGRSPLLLLDLRKTHYPMNTAGLGLYWSEDRSPSSRSTDQGDFDDQLLQAKVRAAGMGWLFCAGQGGARAAGGGHGAEQPPHTCCGPI